MYKNKSISHSLFWGAPSTESKTGLKAIWSNVNKPGLDSSGAFPGWAWMEPRRMEGTWRSRQSTAGRDVQGRQGSSEPAAVCVCVLAVVRGEIRHKSPMPHLQLFPVHSAHLCFVQPDPAQTLPSPSSQPLKDPSLPSVPSPKRLWDTHVEILLSPLDLQCQSLPIHALLWKPQRSHATLLFLRTNSSSCKKILLCIPTTLLSLAFWSLLL